MTRDTQKDLEVELEVFILFLYFYIILFLNLPVVARNVLFVLFFLQNRLNLPAFVVIGDWTAGMKSASGRGRFQVRRFSGDKIYEPRSIKAGGALKQFLRVGVQRHA